MIPKTNKSILTAAICVSVTVAVAVAFGQSRNEYAHNPLTPGYGISNYFKLMPDKVAIARVKRSPATTVRKIAIDAAINRGTAVILRAAGIPCTEELTVAVFSVSGCRVWRQNGCRFRNGNPVMIIPLQRRLPGGVCFVSVSGSGIKKQASKVVVWQ